MRILFDGQFDSNGNLQDRRGEYLLDYPTGDVNRFQYDPESLAEQAKSRVLDFAEKARIKAIGDSGAGHREALLTKGVLAVLTIAHTDSQLFDTNIAPAITAAFEAEAERREKGETADDLMVASAKKMLASLMVHGLVEGRVKSLSDKIETTPANELDELLAVNQAEARAELREVLGEQGVS